MRGLMMTMTIELPERGDGWEREIRETIMYGLEWALQVNLPSQRGRRLYANHCGCCGKEFPINRVCGFLLGYMRQTQYKMGREMWES